MKNDDFTVDDQLEHPERVLGLKNASWESSTERPKVGLGVLTIREGKVLLGMRAGSHGAGTWHPPGGHLEFGEDPVDCAVRELFEETGLKARKTVPGPWANAFFTEEGKHYISLFMFVTEFEGEPAVMEPEKCRCWGWFPLDRLPEPLFLPLKNLVETQKLMDLVEVFVPNYSAVIG